MTLGSSGSSCYHNNVAFGIRPSFERQLVDLNQMNPRQSRPDSDPVLTIEGYSRQASTGAQQILLPEHGINISAASSPAHGSIQRRKPCPIAPWCLRWLLLQ